jgi:hypothetical protein
LLAFIRTGRHDFRVCHAIASKPRRLITQSVVGTLTALVFGPATLCFSVHIVLVAGAGTKVKDNPRNN